MTAHTLETHPLKLRFRMLTLGEQLGVTDDDGQLVFFVQQEILKLKEAVHVFADSKKHQLVANIKADRILDVSACYDFTDPDGNALGAVQRREVRSIWRATYDVLYEKQVVMKLRERSPLVKVIDAMLGRIPVIGLLSAYVCHPAYNVKRPDGKAVMRLKKRPSLREGKFKIEKLGEMNQSEETRVLMSLLMIVLLERHRG